MKKMKLLSWDFARYYLGCVLCGLLMVGGYSPRCLALGILSYFVGCIVLFYQCRKGAQE